MGREDQAMTRPNVGDVVKVVIPPQGDKHRERFQDIEQLNRCEGLVFEVEIVMTDGWFILRGTDYWLFPPSSVEPVQYEDVSTDPTKDDVELLLKEMHDSASRKVDQKNAEIMKLKLRIEELEHRTQ